MTQIFIPIYQRHPCPIYIGMKTNLPEVFK